MRQQSLSNKDWQLLSEYMDGQLSPRDKTRLEQRLTQHEDLRIALDELRRTRAVLRSVRMKRVPRSFTLTPAMLPQLRANPFLRLAPALNFASIASAVALVIVLAVGLLPGLSGGGALSTAQEAPSMIEAAPAAAPAAAGETPVIIHWQAPYGMGGGGGSEPQIMSDGAREAVPEGALIAPPAAEGKGLPGVTEAPAAPALEATLPMAGLVPEATPEPQMQPQAAPTQIPDSYGSLATEEPRSVSQAPLEGAQPILGVRPADEAAAANQAAIESVRQQVRTNRTAHFPWAAPVILALITAGSWLTARILRRKYGA